MEKIDELVSRVLAARGRDTKVTRELAKGLNRYTEQYAYPHVLPYTNSPREEDIFLRVAGLIASSSIAQRDDVTFGEFVKKSEGDFENSLILLTKLSQEQAVVSINRLLIRCEGSKSGGFNWYGLARTLTYWGNGVSDNSLKVRQAILRDFYRVKDNVELAEEKSAQ